MKNLINKIVQVCIALICSACNQPEAPDCFKSTGNQQIQYRIVPDFNAIALEDNVHLWLTYSNEHLVRVEAGKNLIDKIKMEVIDGMLIISNANTCNWVRSYNVPVNVYIASDQVTFIRHTGFGNVTFQNLWQCDYLEYKHYGAGNLKMNIQTKRLNFDHNGLGKAELAGNAEEAFFAVQNLGPLTAEGLKVSKCTINNGGKADAFIRCTQELTAKVTSVGSIYYYGNPLEVHKLTTGSGRIVPL